MNKVIIRPVFLSDAEKITEWLNQLVHETPEIVEHVSKTTVEQQKQAISNSVWDIRENKAISFVALQDNKIVAKIDIKKRPREIDNHVGEAIFGVLDGYDEAGIALIDEACKKAKDIGVENVVYYMLDSNQRFLQLFKESGFEEVGRMYNFYKRDKEYFHRVIMQKFLNE